MGWRIGLAIVCGGMLALAGCAAPPVLVPARVSLDGYGPIALVGFTSNTDESLRDFATQRFLEAVQAAQAGAPLLELGDVPTTLRSVGRDKMDIDAIRAIGEKYRVQAVLTGHLEVTDVKPRINLSMALERLSVGAHREGELRVKLQETRSGATLWANSARGTRSVGGASVGTTGLPNVRIGDQDAATSALVSDLVVRVTDDLRPYYAKR